MGSWIHGMVDKFTRRTDEEAMMPERKVVGAMEMEIPQELAVPLQQALEGGHWRITVWREAGPIVHVFRQTERFSKDRMEEALELL